MSERRVNKEGWLWMAPEYFNRWRVWPRAFIIFYFWLTYETAMWFMGIPVPGPSQAAFASAVIGAGAAWFGLYVNSGTMTSRSTPSVSEYQVPQPPFQNINVSPQAPSEVATGVTTYQVKGE